MAVVRVSIAAIGIARGRGRAWVALVGCVACVLVGIAGCVPAVGSAVGATTGKVPTLKVSIPASARVKGGPTTTTPASTTPASTTPAGTTPASTTPSGSQPGTVAPASTTPTGATTPATTTPGSTTTTSTPSGVPSKTVVVVSHKPSSKSTRLSAWALALAILGALLALSAIVWALARWLALEPHWAVSLTYSMREASNRASSTWAEFTDWVRLGH